MFTGRIRSTERVEELRKKWEIEPIPDEPTPEGKGKEAERAFSVRNYGLNTWGDLFNSRQKLALITFVDKVREAYRKMVEEEFDEEYAKVFVTYLALNFDIFVTYNCNLARYRGDTESIERIFDRQALQMVWDYREVNPFGKSRGDWLEILNFSIRVIENNSKFNNFL